MKFHHLFQCPCGMTYVVRYNFLTLMSQFWEVKAQIADTELAFYIHKADCMNNQVDEFLAKIEHYEHKEDSYDAS